MSEPTYGSGPAYDPQQGYGGAPGYGQQYGGQAGQQYGTGQQPQQPGPAAAPVRLRTASSSRVPAATRPAATRPPSLPRPSDRPRRGPRRTGSGWPPPS